MISFAAEGALHFTVKHYNDSKSIDPSFWIFPEFSSSLRIVIHLQVLLTWHLCHTCCSCCKSFWKMDWNLFKNNLNQSGWIQDIYIGAKKVKMAMASAQLKPQLFFWVFSFCDLQKRSKALIVRSQLRSWPFFNPLMDTFIRWSIYTKCPLWKTQFAHRLKLNCSCLTNNNMGSNSDLQGKQFSWFLTSPIQLGKSKEARILP